VKRKKPVYIYEIGIPVSEFWIYVVEGTSIKDAYRNVKNGHDSAEQTCSLSAPTGQRKIRFYKRKLKK
jgi:hypothetical protein